MTFLLPIGLLALLTLPIIALLHLIQQRRERLRVPSLQIWRDLQRQTTQQKPRRLPLTLLLLLHLLLALLLALALGQPLWRTIQAQATHTAIILDTSSSMAATDERGDRLTSAGEQARQLMGELRRGDTAALIELSTQPRILAQGDGADTSALSRELDRVQAGGPDGDVQAAINLAQATSRDDGETRIVVLTDRSLVAPETLAVAADVDWRVLGGEGDNVAIVAFAARSLQDGRSQLYARVANLGTTPTARTLQLDLDGQRAATEPMRLSPGGEAEWSWPLPAGTERAVASLSGSDLQPLDDRAAVVLTDAISSHAVLVSSTNTPLERALQAQRGLTLQTMAPEAYQPTLAADLVVFNGFVPDELPSAAVLVVAPPRAQSLIAIQSSLSSPTDVVVADERFAAIDFRPVTFDAIDRVVPPPWASVAVDSSAGPLVLTGQYNDRPITIWAFDPAASNIQNRLAFPLLTAATTRTLLPQAIDQLAVGAIAPFDVRLTDGTVVAAGSRLTRPGIYESLVSSGAIAVNATDAAESNLQAREQPRIQRLIQPAAETEAAMPVGQELWKPLVIAGLLVLLTEWLYVHRGRLRRTPRTEAVRS